MRVPRSRTGHRAAGKGVYSISSPTLHHVVPALMPPLCRRPWVTRWMRAGEPSLLPRSELELVPMDRWGCDWHSSRCSCVRLHDHTSVLQDSFLACVCVYGTMTHARVRCLEPVL